MNNPDQDELKLKLAQCHLRMGHMDACRKLTDEMLSDDPDSPHAHFLAGTVFSSEKKQSPGDRSEFAESSQ